MIKKIVAIILLLTLWTAIADITAQAEKTADEKAKQRELKQEANLNLWRLQKSIDEEGFYAARVALNVWRSTAIDAGTFDQEKYDELKKQLYEKSIDNSLKCFEFLVETGNVFEANICLQKWKMHCQEIGVFEEKRYDELMERLEGAKSQKPFEEQKPSGNAENQEN